MDKVGARCGKGSKVQARAVILPRSDRQALEG
ncbi:hypothetical protein Esi_0027_0077 [Ectocarpus siliculosus]|uniref:Uncharacterized protein n=1 Tax=Ectocarpus siliculosus TaxID=2880 RepID=D7FUD6_ECTSI|nr:hypothetical protein Esi_0027_0077 [Ectocarpus siliculosus]|eukprot:CBJ26206.1 hypothetical protein Esi_0027_0077 [Ectocarpus siliculosus]